MRKPGKEKAPQDTSLRACILQEAPSLHINLLPDQLLWLLLSFSRSGPGLIGGGVWVDRVWMSRRPHTPWGEGVTCGNIGRGLFPGGHVWVLRVQLRVRACPALSWPAVHTGGWRFTCHPFQAQPREGRALRDHCVPLPPPSPALCREDK